MSINNRPYQSIGDGKSICPDCIHFSVCTGIGNQPCIKCNNYIPSADVRPVVLCRDCKFWHDAYVKQDDGIERQYRDDETDELGLLPHCVSNDIGINVGAKCRIEDNCGWNCDKSVFRKADDYCSRGKKRPCSYEEWWGIVDGIYPKQYDTDMRNQEGDTP